MTYVWNPPFNLFLASTYQTLQQTETKMLDLTLEQEAFGDHRSDVRVFNPHSNSYRGSELTACYRRHEGEKRRAYEHRVREVEQGSFTPLVLSTSGGMGRAATVVYKRLATLISTKREQPYSNVMGWLRCHLSFSLLRSTVMCLRGSRSRQGFVPHFEAPVDLVLREGRIPT